MTPVELRVGLRCMAPLKNSAKAARREYREVEIVWLSQDGRVAEVVEAGKRRGGRHSFAASTLRPLGTKTPAMGVVL